jgi:hypothetical protein
MASRLQDSQCNVRYVICEQIQQALAPSFTPAMPPVLIRAQLVFEDLFR